MQSSLSEFTASAVMFSGPATLPLLICLVAKLISSTSSKVSSVRMSVCSFDIRLVQLDWSFQEFFIVLFPLVPMCLNLSGWLVLLILDCSP